MSRIAYVNGRYVPHGQAVVHIEDRGYQFSDGVYEVMAVRRGRLVDAAAHFDRLERSLTELAIPWPMSRRALGLVLGQILRRNRMRDGMVYLQVTRGVARRNHLFPAASAPALVITARHGAPPRAQTLRRGMAVITLPDLRWKRCDIKAISLLPAVLGRQRAREAGADEAWLVDDRGFVTEGAATNAWIVTAEGILVTHPADHAILAGVSRAALLRLAKAEGLEPVERPFTVAEAKGAREAFVTGSTACVRPVIRIDDTVIGDGAAGPLTCRLQDAYLAYIEGPGSGPETPA